MEWFRSMVFVSFVLSLLSIVDAVPARGEYFDRYVRISNSCRCNATEIAAGPILRLCLKRSHQTLVCKPCRMKYQTYLSCSKCSVSEHPVCDDEGLSKLNNKYLSIHTERSPRKDDLQLISQWNPFKANATHFKMEDFFHRNLTYTMYTISHPPFFTFAINNCGSSSKHFNELEINLIFRAMKIFDAEFLKLFSMEQNVVRMMHIPYKAERFRVEQKTDKIDKILHKLCNSGLSTKHEIETRLSVLKGIKSRLSPLRHRREVERSGEHDGLFRITDKASEMREKWATTRFGHRYEQRSTKEDAITEATTKHFRKTRKPPASKKHPHRVRGKKHRVFNKKMKHNNGNSNSSAKFKSLDLSKGLHPNKTFFDKQTTRVGLRFDDVTGNGSYKESEKANATYVKLNDDVSLSEISRDVSVTSSFSRDTGSTEAPWGINSLHNQQFSEQTSQNFSANGAAQLDFRNRTLLKEMNESHNHEEGTTGHNLSSQLYDRQRIKPESNFKLLPTDENSKIENISSSNVFQGLTRPNDTSYSSAFPNDANISSNETTKYGKDLKTVEKNDHSAINTSPITLSHTIEEAKMSVYSIENLDFDGVKNTDKFINMSSHVTGERMVKRNSSTASKGENISNEMDMPNHSENKFLVTYSYQSDLNYVTGQHLLNNASSEHLIETGETAESNGSEAASNLENMTLTNIFGKQQKRLTNVLPSAQSKNDDINNTNYRTPYNIVSTMPSSLRDQDFSPHVTERKMPGNKVNGDIIGLNGEISSDNVADVSLQLRNQQGQMVNSSTTRKNEIRDAENGNFGKLADSSSRISFTGNWAKEYSTNGGSSEYKLKENQTLVTSQIIGNFPVVTPNLPDQQQQNLTSKTFIGEGSYKNNEVNYRRAKFISTNKNDTNQTLLEKSEHTLDKNTTKETNLTEPLYDILGKLQSSTENNTFDGITGNNRKSEGTETNHRDSLFRLINGNENKGLPFNYETGTKSNERNLTVGFKHNHMLDHSGTMSPYFSVGELSRTTSKENISDYVDKLNFRMFKDSETWKNSSGYSTDDTNIHVPLYYRKTKHEVDDYESSTTVKHDNISINPNQTTVKNDDRDDSAMRDSFNLDSRSSNIIRYKRDRLAAMKGSKIIQNDRKDLNGGFQSKKVLFTEELSVPSTVIERSSVGHHKGIYIHIPEKSVTIMPSPLNSSDSVKNQNLFYNGTPENAEKENKEILKIGNIRIKYKSPKHKCIGICKNDDEFYAVSPNFKKEQKVLLKSIKIKQAPDRYSKDNNNKQLDVYSTTSDFEKKHQFFHLRRKNTESTKHNSPTYENGENPYGKGMSVELKQVMELIFPEKLYQPLLKENPNDILLQRTSEKVNDTRMKYVNPKVRTGRKLFHFTQTDGNKLVVYRLGTPNSLRRRRSVKNFPENNWCDLPDGLNFKRMDCTVWTYQKECVVSCSKENNVQGSNQAVHTCARKKNVWEPKMQSCVEGGGTMENIDLKEYAIAKENKKHSADSKKSGKSQDTTLPSYDYISNEDYDEGEYEYEDVSNHVDKKPGR